MGATRLGYIQGSGVYQGKAWTAWAPLPASMMFKLRENPVFIYLGSPL